MKLFIQGDEKFVSVIQEAVSDLNHEIVCEQNANDIDLCVKIEFDENIKGLTLEKKEETGMILLRFGSRSAMLRGIGHVLAGETDVKELPAFATLSAMPDCSRNAVMKVSAVQKLIRTMALMGFNGLMLYTEDTYEVPQEKRFGHLRGRYTQAELRELDAYAARFGVELIPCIQMLAHFDAIMKWPEYAAIKDWDNILNLALERSYELLEHCIQSISECFTTRKINIGMDEAYLLGRGHYLEKCGFRTGTEIMRDHLERVMKLLRKHSFRPMMWSDMFFRQCNPSHTYRDKATVITEDVIKAVPEDMTLIYWDYYQEHQEDYARQFGWHEEFKKPFAFAGGSSSWYGLVPLNRFSVYTARMALAEALKRTNRLTGERSIHDVICTMWGDNGGQCSEFATLTTLQLYAEAQWCGEMSDAYVAKRFRACTGADYEAFLAMEDIENLPGRTTFGKRALYPSRYMFYQDVMQGKYDAHVPAGSEAWFEKCKKDFLAIAKDQTRCGSYGYLFETFAAFSEVLSMKAELGLKVRKAYIEKNIDAMREYVEKTLPNLMEATEKFLETFQTQWMKENKAFGFEVQDIRLGGVLARLKYAKNVLKNWVEVAGAGEFMTLEELEAERIPIREFKEKDVDGVLISENKWANFVSASLI